MIVALRQAAQHVAGSDSYEWGNMGGCNCGHVAQAVTGLTRGEIHRAAMARYGDWATQLRDYCPNSGLPLDVIIDRMLEMGFTRQDLAHLERLSDPHILEQLAADARHLRHNVREDVVVYLTGWANLLEADLLKSLSLSPEMEGAQLAEVER